jgi:hypothetical protein
MAMAEKRNYFVEINSYLAGYKMEIFSEYIYEINSCFEFYMSEYGFIPGLFRRFLVLLVNRLIQTQQDGFGATPVWPQREYKNYTIDIYYIQVVMIEVVHAFRGKPIRNSRNNKPEEIPVSYTMDRIEITRQFY